MADDRFGISLLHEGASRLAPVLGHVRDAARLADCKAAVGEMMSARTGWVLDAAWANAWTAADEDFWDSVHFLDHFADQLIDAIKAVQDGKPSEWATKLIVVSGQGR